MVNIGLLGLGTVGTGVVEIIRDKNLDINISKILVNNIKKKRDVDIAAELLTDDFNDILNDEDISIVVEVTSDLETSYKNITLALEAGKHVVTSNKAIVSKYFEELSTLAAEKNLAFLYEGSVGGGIPVIKPLREQLALNSISEVQGILNGTSNYILTRMVNENKEYAEILKTAQDLGYAEADPTADVEGIDAQRKLRILATLSLQGKVSEDDILLEGMSSISALDIKYIKEMDATVKLIAEAKLYEDGYTAVVQPTIVKNSDYFANVNMAFNSVAFAGDNVGELKFYGPGAGKETTANAVLSDVLDIINNTFRKGNPLGDTSLKNNNDKIRGRYYVRVSHPEQELVTALNEMSNRLIMEGDQVAILTEDISLSKIMTKLSSFDVKKGRYFLASIKDGGL